MTERSPKWRDVELTPTEALEVTINRALISSTHRNGASGTPGQVVSKMPEHVRKALRELRAEDIQNVRADTFLGMGESSWKV